MARLPISQIRGPFRAFFCKGERNIKEESLQMKSFGLFNLLVCHEVNVLRNAVLISLKN